MSRRMLLGCRIGVAVLGALAGASHVAAAVNQPEEIFDGAGYSPYRTPFMQLPYEHIDPLTGNLMLTFTDLVLPGNAGFDLKFQRTYNSKIRNGPMNQVTVDDSWAGLGWTFHFGRVIDPAGANPVIEMPDGSRHEAWRAVASGLFTNTDFITKDFWRFRPNGSNVEQPPTLELPNGIKYTFKHVTLPYAYATKIEDPFGNVVTISYMLGGTGGDPDSECASMANVAAHDAICKVTQDLGSGQSRVVKFTAGFGSTLKAVSSMQYAPLGTWSYTHASAGGIWDGSYSILTNVVPPTGGAGWVFSYYTTPGTGEVKRVTTPYGGSIEYTYAQKLFHYGPHHEYRTKVVTSRTAYERDNTTEGTWQYKYPEDVGPPFNKSRHTSPCGVETTYEFHRIGTIPYPLPPEPTTRWATGFLVNREVRHNGELLEEEGMEWRRSDLLSTEPFHLNDPPFEPIHAGMPQKSAIVRGNGWSETTHWYHIYEGHLNDYGRPYRTLELHHDSGERDTVREFHPYNFSRYIADRLSSATVSGPHGGPFTESWVYDTNDGFLQSQTAYGVKTIFRPWLGFRGNPEQSEDANGKITHYTYKWGVLENVDTPEYVIHQTINPAGTVQEQWRGDATNPAKTLYSWDALGRLRTIDPPLGNTTTFTYDNQGLAESWSRARGQSSLTALLDGFGRPVETTNAVGIATQTRYDDCGRVEFESYPYKAPHGGPDKGVTYEYDALDRVRRKTFPNTAAGVNAIEITYLDPLDPNPADPDADGLTRWIKDEDGKTTKYEYRSFGNLRQPYLVGVVDADGIPTRYEYNPLGRLVSVIQPGASRTFHYNTKDQLDYEVHPESGQTSYTYHPNGTLWTREDSRSVVATHAYDGNSRVRSITYNTNGVDDVSFEYNDYDQRTVVGNSAVGTNYIYDDANRLRFREDDFTNGPAFTTEYVPDDNDNIGTIVYPSGMEITYTYDDENRLELVRRNGQTLASDFEHHPSGGLLSYRAGNDIVHKLGYDERYRQKSYSTADVLSFTLDLSPAGDVTKIDDSRSGFSSTPLVYDNLHRLKEVHGFGASTYEYDLLGNRKRKTLNGQTTNYHYENSTQRLDYADGDEADDFSWHLNGLLTSDNVANYLYSGRDMLLRVDPKDSSPDTDYAYDGDNLRAVKTRNGQARYFIHGPRGELLAEHVRCGTSNPTLAAREYIFAGNRLLAGTDFATKPVLSLQTASQSLFEPAGAQTLPVTLTTWDRCPTTEAVTLPYVGTGITATVGSDFVVGPGTSLVFPAGTAHGATQSLDFFVANDSQVENDETFNVDLQPPTGGIVGAIGTHSVTIRDDDGTVTLSPAAVTVAEPGAQITFTVRRKNSNDQPSSNQIRVNHTTMNGTAVAPGDYTHAPGILLFDAGLPDPQERTFTVQVNNDSVVECAENFTASLIDINGGAPGSPTSALVTITDNDLTNLSVQDAPLVLEGNTGTTNAVFNVLTSQVPCGVATVSYQTADQTAVAGGTYPDYQARSGVLTIAGGSGSVAVPVVGDTVHEDATQTFQLLLVGTPTNATVADAQGIATIQDNDAPAAYSISALPGYPEGDEGVSPAPFTVSRQGNLSEPTVLVNYVTANGTASVIGGDYVSTAGQVTFPPFSQASQQLTVGIRGDSLDEGEETFYVNLSVANPQYGTAGPAATGRIQDDDPAALSPTELFHGIGVEKQLGVCYPAGDWYRIGQSPYSSYEVVTDGTATGDGFINTQRYKGDALTPWGPGSVPAAGNTWSRSLRWMNDTAASVTNEAVQVHRTGSPSCAGGYRYRIRSYDTTYSIARFNNSATQVTTLLIQNSSNESVSGRLYFWSDAGVLLATQTLSVAPGASVAPKATYVLVTSTIPALAGQSGSITIANTGRYGALSGKAVSLEPAGGFVYESPLEPRR